MEKELSSIVTEVYDKTWESEIEAYRRSIILERVQVAVRKIEADWERSSFLNRLPTLRIKPGRAFLYTIPAIWFFLKGYGYIGPTHWFMSLMAILFSGAFILSLSHGPNIWKKLKKKKAFKIFWKKHSDYLLGPADLVHFWEDRIQVFLDRKKGEIDSKIQSCKSISVECQDTIQSVQALNKPADNRGAILGLQNKIEDLSTVTKEARQVRKIVEKLEIEFKKRIDELSALLSHQEKIEAERQRLESLNERVGNLLGKSEATIINWDYEKQEIQEQVQELVKAFQDQLFYTRDFIRAELELNYQSLETKETVKKEVHKSSTIS
jgi:hypothetical protein